MALHVLIEQVSQFQKQIMNPRFDLFKALRLKMNPKDLNPKHPSHSVTSHHTGQNQL